jgi:hypothetical protein
VTEDRANNEFENGVQGTSTKSKNLFGARSYFQYSMSTKLQAYNSLGFIYRKDKDDWARSNVIQRGRDSYFDISLGLAWAVPREMRHARAVRVLAQQLEHRHLRLQPQRRCRRTSAAT